MNASKIRSKVAESAIILLDADEENVIEAMASSLCAVGYDCRVGKSVAHILDVLDSGNRIDVVCSGVSRWDEDRLASVVGACVSRVIPVITTAFPLEYIPLLRSLEEIRYEFLMASFRPEHLLLTVHRALRCRRLILENLYLRNKIHPPLLELIMKKLSPPCLLSTEWRTLYRAAILEINKSVVRQRISQAEQAVLSRRREIFYDGTTEEKEALEDAPYARTERLGSTLTLRNQT